MCKVLGWRKLFFSPLYFLIMVFAETFAMKTFFRANYDDPWTARSVHRFKFNCQLNVYHQWFKWTSNIDFVDSQRIRKKMFKLKIQGKFLRKFNQKLNWKLFTLNYITTSSWNLYNCFSKFADAGNQLRLTPRWC